MKVFLLIILVLGVLAQSLSKVIVVSSYLLNKQEITVRYCVNKSKPTLHCQGMCHLKKKLAEENNKDGQGRSASTELSEIILFHRDAETLLKLPLVTKSQHYLVCLCPKTSSYQATIFHPPSA